MRLRGDQGHWRRLGGTLKQRTHTVYSVHVEFSIHDIHEQSRIHVHVHVHVI